MPYIRTKTGIHSIRRKKKKEKILLRLIVQIINYSSSSLLLLRFSFSFLSIRKISFFQKQHRTTNS